jgi:hypothetical protein
VGAATRPQVPSDPLVGLPFDPTTGTDHPERTTSSTGR